MSKTIVFTPSKEISNSGDHLSGKWLSNGKTMAISIEKDSTIIVVRWSKARTHKDIKTEAYYKCAAKST